MTELNLLCRLGFHKWRVVRMAGATMRVRYCHRCNTTP